MGVSRSILFVLPVVLMAADCTPRTPPDSAATPPPQLVEPLAVTSSDTLDGLDLRLSDGAAPGGAAPRLPAAATTPLDAARTAELLSRLSPLDPAPRADFAVRPASRPPPRPGTTVDVAFPPTAAVAPPEVPTGPVSVLRWQPDGDVPIAAHVSLTFDRPMVALSTQDVAAAHVPVTLAPQPEGQWRWLGTRTLVFEPDVRMPMATDYVLSVAPGTQAADGSTVDAPFEARFATPPLALRSHIPHGHHTVGRLPVITLAFDQAVHPEALLGVLQVEAQGKPVSMRLATSTEVLEDPQARALFDTTPPERRAAFVPVEPLPLQSTVTVRLPKGTPSAEGPRRTTGDQSFPFRTYGPFQVTLARCGWQEPCRPGQPLSFEMSNAIDVDVDLSELATSDPAIPGMRLAAQGNTLVVVGRTEARTAYTVTVQPGLTDVFGQTMDKAHTHTFRVGDAAPAWPNIYLPGGNVQVLDPYAPPTLSAAVTGMKRVRVRIAAVTPADWPTYVQPDYDQKLRDDEGVLPLPGTILFDGSLDVPGDPDVPSLLPIALADYLPGGHGQLVVEVRTPRGTERNKRRQDRTWVQATQLGLSVFADAGETYVVVNDLKNGEAVAGAEVRLANTVLGTTNAQGWFHTGRLADQQAEVITVRLADDLALLSPSGHAGRWGTWNPGSSGVQTTWFVFNDRQLYRPSEDVHIKGWLRDIDFAEGGDLRAPEGLAGTVTWTLRDSQNNEIGAGTTQADRLGGFDISLTLPGTPNLGATRLDLSHPKGHATHSFDIREFRRPEFGVSAQIEDAGPHVVGSQATAALTATYYAGGGLPNAEATWQVTAEPGTWSPPGWTAFRFGTWTPTWWSPWWRHGLDRDTQRWTFQGTTDANGTHRLRMDFLGMHPSQPMTVTANGSVQDVQRQTWSGTATLLVHPADLYVGVRTTKGFYDKGDKVQAELVVVNLDGEALADVTIEAALVRTEMVWKRGTWEEREAERLPCTVISRDDVVTCSFQPKVGGRYDLHAAITDARGRANASRMPVWISGGSSLPRVEGVSQETITLVPDAEEYAPGDVAKVLVQAPFAPAEGVVTWLRAGIVHTERLVLETTSTTLQIPIEETFIPGMHVQVDLFGDNDRTDAQGTPVPQAAQRPAYATGQIRLPVPPRQRALDVTVTPQTTASAPGETTSVTVVVKDARGRPVPQAQVAIVVVDEAVLALSGYRIPHPLDLFHPERGLGHQVQHNRAWVRLADVGSLMDDGAMGGAGNPMELQAMGYAEEGLAMDMVMEPEADGAPRAAMRGARVMMKSAAAPGAPPPEEPDAGGAAIAVRSDFRPDALFAPTTTTGPNGSVTVPLPLPDNLTRYRISAVVVDDGRSFGTGEADLTVRLPLMLRPSPPRFLNFGDAAELPLVVQNQTDQAQRFLIALRSDNARIGSGTQAGFAATVPANDRVEVRFPVSTERAGRAHFQAAITATGFDDAASFDLPVWTPATSEAFATYGSLTGPAGIAALKQPIDVPDDVWPQFGGLEIDTSSTALQALTDAFIYLVDYPYGCAEQIGSRVLSVAALRDVLQAFDAPGLPDPASLQAMVDADLEELRKRQNRDGSWGFWRYGERPSVWTSLHVTHALVRAQQAGFTPDARTLQRGLQRLQNIDGLFDRWWTEPAKNVVRAQALMIRDQAGQDVAGEALALYRKAGGTDKLPLEALGWLLPALDDATTIGTIHRFVNNRATETAATAEWTSAYTETDSAMLLHGDRRTDAVLLDALLQTDPTSKLLPKVVEGLMGHKVKGRWGSTQDNAWVLLALRRYFHVAEGVTPDFVARAWLGDGFAGEHTFQGRTVERARIDVPMAWLAETGDTDLTVAREGQGRMYYRLGLRYAPRSLRLDPAERGFTVTRDYEAVDDDGDVWRDDDGTWHVKAGARVRVALRMVAPSRRYHVALVDPLPAGLEAQDPAIQGTPDMPAPADADDPWARPWWWGTWYDHENLRDERVEAFSRNLWAGVHTYSYVARATTPGRFVVPPAKAEEMYHPETFGRTGTDFVVVE